MTDFDDRKGQICTKCGVGNYQETSIHDDWDGVLHCTNKECNHEVKRYKWKDNPPPKPEKVKLSPAAQAVANAVNHYETNHWLTPNQVVAAALRTVATQVTPLSTNLRQNKIRYKLLAIANELEQFND